MRAGHVDEAPMGTPAQVTGVGLRDCYIDYDTVSYTLGTRLCYR